jgi:hypothetical protein
MEGVEGRLVAPRWCRLQATGRRELKVGSVERTARPQLHAVAAFGARSSQQLALGYGATRSVNLSATEPSDQLNSQHPGKGRVGISDTYPVTGPLVGNDGSLGVGAQPADIVRSPGRSPCTTMRIVIARGGCPDRFAHITFVGAWLARRRPSMALCMPRAPEKK